METKFTKEYMTSNRGCYLREKMLEVKCVKENNITLENLFNDLPIKDFTWFLVRKCDLTLTENRKFAIHCAKQVLPIFEKEYPKDKRVRECIEATELYLEDKISLEELREKRSAAADAATYASCAASYAAAATAASYATTASSYADADADAFKISVWEFVESLTNQ